MNRQDLSNTAPGFKVTKKTIFMPKKGNKKNSKFPLYFENFPLYILGAKLERLETVFWKTEKSPYLEIPSHIKKT